MSITTAAKPESEAAAPASTGATLWFTGLSGAGKSTIATALARLLAARGRAVEILDGDELRENLSPRLGFSREDRDAHVTRVGYLARTLAKHGVLAIVPVIAPYAQTRDAVRAAHAAAGQTYLEVYVSTSVEECSRRDVKGLYARRAAGEIAHLTGVDDPYEAPTDPDLRIDTTGSELAADVETVLTLLDAKGLL